MDPKNTQNNSAAVIPVLGLVAVLAAAFFYLEYRAAERLTASLALATSTHQADQAHLQQLTKKVQASEQRQAELEKALQQARVATDAPGRPARAADSSQAAKAKALADGQAFMTAYGQPAHDMLIAIGKAQVARNFAALIESGAITAAQAEAIENQTAEHWIDSMAVTPNSIHPTDPNLSEDQLKGILGDQGFQQYQNYQRMQPLQGLVNDVSSLSFAAPLSPGQSTQLLTVLANSSSNYVGGGKANPQSVNWDQVLPLAQGILSEQQIAALKAEAALPQLMSMVKEFYQNHPPAK
jgi:hypothetical protein